LFDVVAISSVHGAEIIKNGEQKLADTKRYQITPAVAKHAHQ